MTRKEDKVLKYQDIKREIKKLWHLKSVKVVNILVGEQSPKLRKHLDSVNCNLSISNIQKTAVLALARILRKVLDI